MPDIARDRRLTTHGRPEKASAPPDAREVTTVRAEPLYPQPNRNNESVGWWSIGMLVADQ